LQDKDNYFESVPLKSYSALQTLYEEIRSGKVKAISRAELASATQGNRAYQQQPSLFDFSRKGRDVELVKLP